MLGLFKKWIKGKFKAGKQLAKAEDTQIPEPPCRDHWPVLPASTKGALENYGLFQRLPQEVRRHALTHAFGDRTLHVDHRYDHSLARRHLLNKPVSKTRTVMSAQKNEPELVRHCHCGLGSNLARDTGQPKQWQWLSCVCHRPIVEVSE